MEWNTINAREITISAYGDNHIDLVKMNRKEKLSSPKTVKKMAEWYVRDNIEK